MTTPTMGQIEAHNCEKEYWRHCIHCVVGDPDAYVWELEVDCLGACCRCRVTYPDGSEIYLIRGEDGWRFPGSRPPYDAATTAGLDDRDGEA